MKKITLATVSAIAWMPFQTVMAQDLSSEVSPATVWFALLVVVFALLVAVGLFMARDDAEEEQPAIPARKPLRSAHVMKKPVRLSTGNHRKQQEFS